MNRLTLIKSINKLMHMKRWWVMFYSKREGPTCHAHGCAMSADSIPPYLLQHLCLL